jgi:hypothetical protein
MHFDALFALTGFASFVAESAAFFDALAVADLDDALLLQFLFVQWLFKTIDPQVQNSANKITPFIYHKYITKLVNLIIFSQISFQTYRIPNLQIINLIV